MTSRTYNLFMAARRAALASSQSGTGQENIARMGDAVLVKNSAVWPTPQLKALKADAYESDRSPQMSRAVP